MEWVWVLVAALRAVSPAADDQWATRLAGLDEIRSEAYATADPALLDRCTSGAVARERPTPRRSRATAGGVAGSWAPT
jgi:hypothetical protein